MLKTDDANLEHVACPLCGRDDPRPTPYAREPYRVVRCGGCRLWYLSPRLTSSAMENFYRSDDYFSGGEAGYADYARQEKSLRITFRRLLADLAGLRATGGRLLEIGSGLGFFLDESRNHFTRRLGIELSAKASADAAARADAPVYRDIEGLGDEPPFDCIVALHVIEHIHQPVAFLRRIGGLLAPGGTLVLAAPHMGSLWRLAMGRHWPSFKYPEHVAFFDSSTLKRLFAEAGFANPTRLAYLHDFSLSDILAKLHLPRSSLTDRVTLPLPATTICYAARRPFGGTE